MNKREVLELLQELISKSERMVTRDDDPSGMLTEYLVDSEALRRNIQDELEYCLCSMPTADAVSANGTCAECGLPVRGYT